MANHVRRIVVTEADRVARGLIRVQGLRHLRTRDHLGSRTEAARSQYDVCVNYRRKYVRRRGTRAPSGGAT
jgi:hypothetical protein